MANGNGLLVGSKTSEFSGAAKVSEIEDGIATIGFFSSPSAPMDKQIKVPVQDLVRVIPSEQSVVFVRDPTSGIFRRGRFSEKRPSQKYLIIFRMGKTEEEFEYQEADLEEVFLPNLLNDGWYDVEAFVASRCIDRATHLFEGRKNFVSQYLKQRKFSGGYPIFLSSGLEVEPHQISVVKTVLDDPIKRYLLADEVGLGKTIEAGLLIRDHVNRLQERSRVLVSVPTQLLSQWKQELVSKFFLSGHLSVYPDIDTNSLVQLIPHDKVDELIDQAEPTALVIDEGHQLIPKDFEECAQMFAVHRQFSSQCDELYLLSGTPIGGNDVQYLGMLSLLDSSLFSFDEIGLEKFKSRIRLQEQISGYFSILTPDRDDTELETALLNLKKRFGENDVELTRLIECALEEVDFLSDKTDLTKRANAIGSVREYVGNHYKFFRRMIRNRREHPGIDQLFPGLSQKGLIRVEYDVSDGSVDESVLGIIDALAARCDEHSNSLVLITTLVDSILTSPTQFRSYLKSEKLMHNLFTETEIEKWIVTSENESTEKVLAASKFVVEWITVNPEGLAVVFVDCPVERISLRNQILNFDPNITVWMSDSINTDETPQFGVILGSTEIEDGINLHGPRRLIFHYSLTRSIRRLEQRMGRVNRFSASSKGFKPVEVAAILPSQHAFVGIWLDLLDEGLGVFEKTVSSIQFQLEDSLSLMWAEISKQGTPPLLSWAKNKLMGPEGVVQKETARIKFEEQMLGSDFEISKAREFARNLEAFEVEHADESVRKMDGWIRGDLQFDRVGELDDVFQYVFRDVSSKRPTLLDSEHFFKTCFEGMDPDSASGERVTRRLSSRRNISSFSEPIQPMRLGQTFIDSIWKLSSIDPRGITSGYLRIPKNLDLKFVTKVGSFFEIQFVNDERFLLENPPPNICTSGSLKTFWFSDKGEVVDDENLMRFLAFSDPSKYDEYPLSPVAWSKVLSKKISSVQWGELVAELFTKARTQASGLMNVKCAYPIACKVVLVLS